MTETPLPTSASPETKAEPVIIPCARIRTKMYYVLGRQAVDLTHLAVLVFAHRHRDRAR